MHFFKLLGIAEFQAAVNQKQTTNKQAQLTQLDHGSLAFPPFLWQEKTASYAET